MTSPLSWSLHGNDQLSGVLEKLDKTLTGLSRRLDGATGDAKQFGRALGDAEGATTRMGARAHETGGRLDGLGNRVSAVVSRLRDLAAIGVAAFGAAAGAAAVFATKTAAANETAAISFEVLLGSAQKAQAFLAELQKFAAATPFEMPQLRTAASRLLAVGVNTREIIPLLTVLGDATAGMGTGAEGIERAVTALTQMRQKTKVSAEEMLQLTEAGIPAWESLAKVLGTDVAGAMKMVEDRQVDASKVFEAISTRAGPGLQRLSGMMQRQSTTLEGMWSTFKDNVGQTLASFMEPAIPAMKKALDWAGENIPKGLTGLQNMGRQVRDVFAGSDVPERLMNSLRELGQKLLPVLREAWDRIVGSIRDNREGLEKLGRFIADVIIPIVGDQLATSIMIVGRVVEGLVWAFAHVVDAIKFLTEMWLANMQTMLGAAVTAFGWIPGLGPKLKEAEAKFDEFANGVRAKLAALDGKTVNVYVAAHLRTDAELQNSGFMHHRAKGGPVSANQVYMVGEEGPEILYNGVVYPLNGGAGRTPSGVGGAPGGVGGGDVVVNVRVMAPDGRTITESQQRYARQAGLRTVEQLLDMPAA